MSSAPEGPRSVSFAARPGTISCHDESVVGLNCSRNLFLIPMPTPACHLVGPCDQKNLLLFGRLAAAVWPVVL